LPVLPCLCDVLNHRAQVAVAVDDVHELVDVRRLGHGGCQVQQLLVELEVLRGLLLQHVEPLLAEFLLDQGLELLRGVDVLGQWQDPGEAPDQLAISQLLVRPFFPGICLEHAVGDGEAALHRRLHLGAVALHVFF